MIDICMYECMSYISACDCQSVMKFRPLQVEMLELSVELKWMLANERYLRECHIDIDMSGIHKTLSNPLIMQLSIAALSQSNSHQVYELRAY